jgi:hypothetical protein
MHRDNHHLLKEKQAHQNLMIRFHVRHFSLGAPLFLFLFEYFKLLSSQKIQISFSLISQNSSTFKLGQANSQPLFIKSPKQEQPVGFLYQLAHLLPHH